ncbi:hypothetical protein QFZ79_003091 [Arthrobacter sp. V4I6]|nr:hypothetical protein [Arthrobacter sp. V1I7]MDQ0854980.1 hypothetical protein [Arthrobacter sp. V4I6]
MEDFARLVAAGELTTRRHSDPAVRTYYAAPKSRDEAAQ